jgi:hypothetical protein
MSKPSINETGQHTLKDKKPTILQKKGNGRSKKGHIHFTIKLVGETPTVSLNGDHWMFHIPKFFVEALRECSVSLSTAIPFFKVSFYSF